MKQFLTEILGGVDMDQLDAHDEKRIDFSCLDGLFAVELKSLEEDPTPRLENYIDTLRERDDYPHFWGNTPMSTIAHKMGEPDKILAALNDRLGRNIIKHLKKARDQFRAHQLRHPRNEMVRTVILMNEDHTQYYPEFIRNFLSHQLARKNENGPIYDTIDIVWFLTERHATAHGDVLAYPMVAVEGPTASLYPDKRQVITNVMTRWAEFNGYSASLTDDLRQFVPMVDTPSTVSRSENWRIEYERNPYLSAHSDVQLREMFEEIITLERTLFLRSPGPEIKAIRANLPHASLVHVTSEMTHRGITPDEFRPSKKRAIAAARRLKLPNSYIRWLRTNA